MQSVFLENMLKSYNDVRKIIPSLIKFYRPSKATWGFGFSGLFKITLPISKNHFPDGILRGKPFKFTTE